ncbi:hypothetical protein [Aurantibacillus circumpalustris]|uniref:hypothetical protein n=1 Tax=Aurantibacillus circumpalustris TaxID=3036359 RepID=UPI00295C18E9|nr:hypothetical protein [Aurantibacillus circumpalustris]
MNLSAEKLKLTQLILNIESKDLIEKIKNLIKTEDADLWDELNDKVKADVEFALMELDNGDGISNDQVMEKYEKWLKK